MIKAAIFDFDGTIVDSMPVWADAGAMYLDKLGIKAEKNLGDKLLEMSMKEGAEYLKRTYTLKENQVEICKGVNDVIAGAYRNSIPLKDGAKRFLEALESSGTKMVICTNTDREIFAPALKRLGIDHFFEKIFTVSEMHCSKNHPEIFFSAAEFLKTMPEETFVFEDALYAIRTAYKARFKTCALYDAASSGHTDQIRKFCFYYGHNYDELYEQLRDLM